MSEFYPVLLNVDKNPTNKESIESYGKHNKKDSSVSMTNKEIVIKIRDNEMANNTFIRYCIEVYIKCDQHFWFEKTGERSWNVLRRYSDFDSLRLMLIKRYPACLIPPLPCKVNSLIPWKIANQINDTDFIDSRRQRLEWFLDRIIAHPKLGLEMVVLEFLRGSGNWSDIQMSIERTLSGVVNWRWINAQSRLIQIFESANNTPQLNEMLKSKSLSEESIKLVEKGRSLQEHIKNLLTCLSLIEEKTMAMHKLYKIYGEAFFEWCKSEKEVGDALQSFSHLSDNFSNIIESPSTSNGLIVVPQSGSGSDSVCNGLSWHEISLMLQELYDYGESWIELAGRMALVHRQVNRQSESMDDLNCQLDRLKNGQSPKVGAFAQLKSRFSKSLSVSELMIMTESSIYEGNKHLIGLKEGKHLFARCLEVEEAHFECLRRHDLRLVMHSYACNQLAYSQKCLKLWKRAKQTLE